MVAHLRRMCACDSAFVADGHVDRGAVVGVNDRLASVCAVTATVVVVVVARVVVALASTGV